MRLSIGLNPTFFLERDGKAQFAVINGFLYDIPARKGQGKNSMVFR